MAIGQYILVADSGLHPGDRHASGAAALLSRLPRGTSTGPPFITSISVLGETGAAEGPLAVIDTVFDDGPRLVEMHDHAAEAITAGPSPIRAVAVTSYSLPEVFAGCTARLSFPGLVPDTAATAGTAAAFTVVCTDALTGRPLEGCQVLAFDDYAARSGGKGVTDARGRVALTVQDGRIERLYAAGPDSHWGAYRKDVSVAPDGEIALQIQPVDVGQPDVVRRLYGKSRFDAAAGVVVGVIDSGIGPHPDLNLAAVANTVAGEPCGDGEDWLGHGTHVAGLIGARGQPGGLRGMAPGVTLRAYRVFGKEAGSATNYAVLKAMLRAAADGCDIVTLSLAGREADAIVQEAIAEARDRGMLVVIPAGNGRRKSVAYPAAFDGAVAVSALGLRGAFPEGSLPESEIDPAAPDGGGAFVAASSNVGTRVSLAAPGVGVLSTLPGGRYGPMSGTSMAAPVAAGAAACLLSRAPDVLAMPRGRARADAIEKLLLDACAGRGFGPLFEGAGMPDPEKI